MSVGQRIWLMVKFVWAFVESAMVTLTKHVNHISRDYRYIMEVVTLEKRMLKVHLYFTEGSCVMNNIDGNIHINYCFY
jgi:hypothetical protein